MNKAEKYMIFMLLIKIHGINRYHGEYMVSIDQKIISYGARNN